MTAIKEEWKQRVFLALKSVAETTGLESKSIDPDQIIMETPPDPKLGDIAFPLFPFARVFRTAPAQIAQKVFEKLCAYEDSTGAGEAGKHYIQAVGPYLNISLDMTALAGEVMREVEREGERYGTTDNLSGTKVMVDGSFEKSVFDCFTREASFEEVVLKTKKESISLWYCYVFSYQPFPIPK